MFQCIKGRTYFQDASEVESRIVVLDRSRSSFLGRLKSASVRAIQNKTVRALSLTLIVVVSSIRPVTSQEVQMPLDSPPVFGRIEETFGLVGQASAKQDWGLYFECFTKEMQSSMCFKQYVQCSMESNDPKVAAIMRAHGVDDRKVDAALEQRFRERDGAALQGSVQEQGATSPTDEQLMKQVILQLIDDEKSFYVDAMRATTDPNENRTLFETLKSVAVEGDSATAMATSVLRLRGVSRDLKPFEKKVHRISEILFKKQAGEWRIEDFRFVDDSPPKEESRQTPKIIAAPQQ